MRLRLLLIPAVAGVIWAWSLSGGAAQEQLKNKPEEDIILERANAFVEAFGNGDAKALAAFWTLDGDYTDLTGRTLKGRQAIEKSFADFFAENKGLKLRIDIDSLKYVTPDVAIEDGVTSVIPPDGGPPSRAKFTVIHVKKDGKWHLSSVRDSAFQPPSNHEHLEPLEWMIGDWADDVAAGQKGPMAHISFSWAENQNFILSSFATTFENLAVSGGTQFIGWDPEAKRIRSWTFEHSGGFGEGAWTKQGDNKWIVKTTAMLHDGKKVTANNIVTRLDADTISWESKDRAVDGNALPDVPAVKMKRRK